MVGLSTRFQIALFARWIIAFLVTYPVPRFSQKWSISVRLWGCKKFKEDEEAERKEKKMVDDEERKWKGQHEENTEGGGGGLIHQSASESDSLCGWEQESWRSPAGKRLEGKIGAARSLAGFELCKNLAWSFSKTITCQYSWRGPLLSFSPLWLAFHSVRKEVLEGGRGD